LLCTWPGSCSPSCLFPPLFPIPSRSHKGHSSTHGLCCAPSAWNAVGCQDTPKTTSSTRSHSYLFTNHIPSVQSA
jgi:hypothetical protein